MEKPIRLTVSLYSADSVLLTAYFGRDSSLCDTVVRAFRPEEIRLRDMRRKLIDSVYGGVISICFYEGYDPNFVLTEHDGGYKLFLMMGTQLRGVIPFGNDYIFFADSMGTITHWRQLHRSLLSADFGKKKNRKQFLAGKVRAVIHSHLDSEPLITATDICLMRMYGPLLGVDTLIVVSPSLKTRFVYSVQDNAVGMFTIDDN